MKRSIGSLAVTFTQSILSLFLKVIKRVLGFRHKEKKKQASIKRQTNLLNIVLIFPKLFIVIFKNIDIITCFKRFKHSLSRFWLAESILRRPTYARSTSTKHYFIKLRVLLNKVGDKKLKDKLLHIILCLYLLCSRRKVAVMKETILLGTFLSIRRQF